MAAAQTADDMDLVELASRAKAAAARLEAAGAGKAKGSRRGQAPDLLEELPRQMANAIEDLVSSAMQENRDSALDLARGQPALRGRVVAVPAGPDGEPPGRERALAACVMCKAAAKGAGGLQGATELGEGAFGVTWKVPVAAVARRTCRPKAWTSKTGAKAPPTHYAVKVERLMRRSAPLYYQRVLDRFVGASRNAELAGRLGVGPRVHDWFACDAGGQMHLVTVMDLVAGGIELDEWVKKHEPGAAEVERVHDVVATKLKRLHKHGVLHGDVHGGNIMVVVDPKGAAVDVVVIDFGLSKTFDEAAQEELLDVRNQYRERKEKVRRVVQELVREGAIVLGPVAAQAPDARRARTRTLPPRARR